MNTARLVSLLAGWRWAGDEKVQITPEEIYVAATDAQTELLNRLNLLETSVQLALVTGQDTYQFPAQAIESVTIEHDPPHGTVAYAMVRIPGHKYHTGDEVIIYGVLGAIQANGQWIVTKVDADTISLPVTALSDYTSGGTIIHALSRIRQVFSSGIKRLSDSGGALFDVIEKKTISWIESNREAFGVGGTQTNSTPSNSQVIYFGEIYTDPLTIIVLGTPGSDMLTSVRGYRKHVDVVDDISDTVDPLIPSMYEHALQFGTLHHLFEFRTEKNCDKEAEKWEKKFEDEMEKNRRIHNHRKLVQPSNDSGLKW